jgi:hypothetical protein
MKKRDDRVFGGDMLKKKGKTLSTAEIAREVKSLRY